MACGVPCEPQPSPSSGLTERLDAATERFIAEHIDSAEALEILLHLQRHAELWFTADSLSAAVYTVPAAALLRLERLVASGFVESDRAANPSYRYAPADPARRAGVDGLAAAYAEDRVRVIQAIFQRPKSAAQSLADAFRLRGGS
jgi:hypothetical protein